MLRETARIMYVARQMLMHLMKNGCSLFTISDITPKCGTICAVSKAPPNEPGLSFLVSVSTKLHYLSMISFPRAACIVGQLKNKQLVQIGQHCQKSC